MGSRIRLVLIGGNRSRNTLFFTNTEQKIETNAIFVLRQILTNIMKQKFTIIVLLLMAIGTLSAQDTLWMSLDSCLRYAYQHNITMQTSRLNQETSEISYEGAKLRFTPSLSASASENLSLSQGNSNLDGSCGVNANWTLFNGLSNVYNLKSAKISQEQSELKTLQNQNEIGSQIITSYLTIVMNQERINYLKEVLNTTEQQEIEGKIKYEVGKILESDYLLLQANLLQAQNNLQDALLTIENNQLSLRTLLNLGSSQVIGVTGNLDKIEATATLLPLRDSAVAQSLRNLPDVRISQMDVDMAELNVKMAHANFLPTLGLNAGASYYGGNSNMVDGNGTVITKGGINSSMSLSLNIPILNRGTNSTQYKQSKIQLQQAQLQLAQTEQNQQQKVESQYLSTQQSLNKFRISETMEKAYKSSYDVYVTKYAQGAVTTVEMLQQQDKYLNALNDYLQNKYSFMLENRILKIYMGE